jgi:hypothetical protein
MSNDFEQAVRRLAELLSEENDALKRLDFTAAVALVPAKEAALAELARTPLPATPGAATPRAATPGEATPRAAIPGAAIPGAAILAPPLVALGRRLSGLATENQILLERAVEVQTRIVRIIAKAGALPPAVTQYGAHNPRARSHRTNALALSTRA